jgi:peptidoglycan/xylan/chitin deacetylase (PgdA/CDA1 family)
MVCLALALGAGAINPGPAWGADGNTVISLTFDDGHASHMAVARMLRSRGMSGTFYISSGLVDSSPYYLTWSQVHRLAEAGNEIGGHTAHHVPLDAGTSRRTAVEEVCSDRKQLTEMAHTPVSSFSYPEAVVPGRGVASLIRACGYRSARGVGGVSNLACPQCPYGESIPPRDPYKLRTVPGVTDQVTPASLQASVTDAERRGGKWVIFTFHGICDDRCTGTGSMTTREFTQFLDWLAPRRERGTEVRTVGDVASNGRSVPRTPLRTAIRCDSKPCAAGPGDRDIVSISFDHTGGGHAPTATYYTTDGSDPRTSPTAHRYTHPFTVATNEVIRYFSRDVAGRTEPPQTHEGWVTSGPDEADAQKGDDAFLWLGGLLVVGVTLLGMVARHRHVARFG